MVVNLIAGSLFTNTFVIYALKPEILKWYLTFNFERRKTQYNCVLKMIKFTS